MTTEIFEIWIPCYLCRILKHKRNDITAIISTEYIPPNEFVDFLHDKKYDANPVCMDCIKEMPEDVLKSFNRVDIRCHRCFDLGNEKKYVDLVTILCRGDMIEIDELHAFQDRGSYIANFFCPDCVKEIEKEGGFENMEVWGEGTATMRHNSNDL